MNQRAAWKVLIPVLGLSATIALSVSWGQNDPASNADSEFQQLDTRYRQILNRNPKPGPSFDRWYQLHLDSGRLKELVEDCERRVAGNPENSSDQILLAIVCSRTGDLERALKVGEAARKLDPGNYVPALLTGELLQRLGRNSEAAAAYADAVECKPPISESMSIARRLARLYFVAGEADQALKVWSKVEQRFPENISILTEVAHQLVEHEQYDEAILRWEQIRALSKSDLNLRLTAGIEIAVLEAERGRPDEAVAKFDQLLDQVRPDSWPARHLRQKIATVLTEEGGYERLVGFLQQRIENHPDDVDTRLQLASALERTGEFDAAEEQFRQAVRQAPGRRDLRMTYIESLESRHKLDEAAQQARTLTQLDSQDIDAWVLYGRLVKLQNRSGDPIVAEREVAEIWNRIPAIRPDDAQLALQTAELCRSSATMPKAKSGEKVPPPVEFSRFPLLEAAWRHYEEAVRRGPGNPQLLVFQGEFLHACGHRDRAVDVWSELVRPPFDTSANRVLLAQTLQRNGHLDLAISNAREAFILDSENLTAAQLAIELLSQAGRYDEALEQLDAIVELSDDPEVQSGLRKQWVDLIVKSGESTQTLLELELLRSAGKAETTKKWRLGLLCDRTGQFKLAVEVFESMVASDPENPALRRDFSEVLQHAQDLERAVEQYYWIVENSPQPSIQDYERIIDIEIGRKRLDQARAAAQDILRITPSNPDAYRRLADIDFLMQRSDDGLNALRHAVRLAPSEPEYRLELVHRLAEANRDSEALDHCWRCFELMTEPEDRLALMETLMRVAQASQHTQETLARLRELRDLQKRPYDHTRYLIAAYRCSEQLIEARAELEKLIAERPDDIEAIRQMVEVTESAQAWAAAARWQEELVKREETAESLQRLVALYRRAGDDERAEDSWQRYLRSLSPQAQDLGAEVALNLIDAEVQRSNYGRARQMTEWSLNQLPDSAPLRFRLGLILLVQHQYEKSNEAFEAAIRAARSSPATPAQPPGTASGMPPEIGELRAAKSAFLNFSRIGDTRLNNRYKWNMFQNVLNASASDPETLSIIGSLTVANSSGHFWDWIDWRRSQAKQSPIRLREAVLAVAATGQLVKHPELLQETIERLPEDSLPHLAYLDNQYAKGRNNLLSDDERTQTLNAMKRSFQWIAEHRPELRSHVVLNFARQLVVLGDKTSALNAYVETLAHADPVTRQWGAEEIAELQLISDEALHDAIESSGVVPALVVCLNDREIKVTVTATKTLGGLGPEAKDAVSPLIELFSHPAIEVRTESARAIANIGAVSVPSLIEELASGRREARICSALALQQVGRDAAPAVPALIELLSGGDSELQLRAMHALGAIGPEATEAVPVLTQLLSVGASGIQCSAMLTLSEIGPAAKPAVPLLIEQLTTDDRTHQRNAARCLAKIGPDAADALPALFELLKHEDPFLRRLSQQTIRSIEDSDIEFDEPDPREAVAVALHGVGSLDVQPYDWPQWGGWSGRNATPEGIDIPEVWDLKTGQNIKWTVKLGSQTYGPPAVANGKIYVGTNNGNGYVARYPATVDLGVLLCLDEETGQFLWQLSCPKLPTGRVHDWPFQGIPSTPLVDGDRLWLVTNRGEVVCLDTEGFRDQENDGPFKSEPNQNLDEADIVWSLDMMGQLGVSQHNMANCSMTCAGELLFVCTSNGVDESHLNLPAPNAPSFLALDRWTGKVVWMDNSPGSNILHGQWCSPCYAVFDGVPQVIFGGGDGWLYSFVPEGDGKGNSELIWKFDCNPKDSKWVLGGAGTRNNIIAFPAVYDGLLYVAVGQDPEHGEGNGHLWCIDPTGQGDVSPTLAVDAAGNPLPHRRIQAVDESKGERAIPNPESAVVWHFDRIDLNGDGQFDYEEEMHRTTATPVIKDGLVYVADFSGILYCLDAKFSTPDLKPKLYWTYDMFSPAWDSPLVVDGKVYVGDEDGDIAIFKHGTEKKLLHEHYMEHSVKSAPIVANNVLYITTVDTLYAIEKSQP